MPRRAGRDLTLVLTIALGLAHVTAHRVAFSATIITVGLVLAVTAWWFW